MLKNLLFCFPLALGLSEATPKPAPKTIVKTVRPVSTVRKYTLDTNAVHKLYIDGDFDEAIDRLETGLKYVVPLSHEDSVFIFKHLGVMYTSKYETREKGKQFMMRLLEVEPTARIMDMYASDMIYMIFKNIQDEYELAQMKLKRAQGLKDGNNPPLHQDSTQNPPPETAKSHSYKWVPWTVAVVGVAGGAILAYNLMDYGKTAQKKDNVIP